MKKTPPGLWQMRDLAVKWQTWGEKTPKKGGSPPLETEKPLGEHHEKMQKGKRSNRHPMTFGSAP